MGINEFDLITKLERRFGKPSVAVEVGVGDDAAVTELLEDVLGPQFAGG